MSRSRGDGKPSRTCSQFVYDAGNAPRCPAAPTNTRVDDILPSERGRRVRQPADCESDDEDTAGRVAAGHDRSRGDGRGDDRKLVPRPCRRRRAGRRGGSPTGGLRRIGTQPPESILCRLPQRASSRRGRYDRFRARCAASGNGARARHGGRGTAERRRRVVGAGERPAPGGFHAAGGTPAARRGGSTRGGELARVADGRGRRDESESRQDRFDAPPEPHGVRQRGP